MTLKLLIKVLKPKCSCPFFALLVGRRCCHKESLWHISARSVQAIKDHHHQLREQNHAGCEWTGVWLLQLSLLRLRVPWGKFWVVQSKGAVCASLWSLCPWVTAWVQPLLAPPRLQQGPAGVPALGHTDASGISNASAFFYTSLWSSGLLIHSLKWELRAQSSICVTVLPSCSLELIFCPRLSFCQSVLYLSEMKVIWKSKSVKRRPCLRVCFVAVQLLKQAVFAQIFKFFGEGTISPYRSELVLRWWYPNLEWGL